MGGPPPAEGVRTQWADVPERVRQSFEQWAGSAVESAASQPSGFSPGVAARLQLADGRRVFVKAVGPKPNADSPPLHRREARIVAALPANVPVPRLRWLLDEGEGGWVLLAFDDVTGQHPAQPWRLDELDRVAKALTELATALTPSPISADAVPSAGQMLTTNLCGWQRLRNEQPPELEHLDGWSRRNLDALADLEARAPDAVSGDTLLHFDVRADNILLARDRVWFFDWPHACIGAGWLDVLGLAPSVTMQGGPLPEEVISRFPACRSANQDRLTAALASIAGYFARNSLQPPPPGLPTLRAFQAAQGAVVREWLARRTGWS